MVLARTLMRGSDALRAAAKAITRGEPYVGPIGTPSAELEALAAELALAHASLDEARRHERAIEDSRRELIAWVSHDLRTPLAGIRAMAEALEDDVVSTDEDRSLYHRRIRVEVDRLARMVDDLFELSRIHAGALQLSLREMELTDVVREAIATASPVARAKGITLRSAGLDAERSPGRRRPVRADPRRRQPAGECDPAHPTRRHGRGRSRLRRRLRVCVGQRRMWWHRRRRHRRVFDVAFRGTPARTPAPDGGAGLGLAIARGIVDAHKGRIGAENVGPGCRFTIALPRAHSPLARSHTNAHRDQPNGRIRGDAESLA